MENTQFDQYSPSEFVQEFFRTFVEVIMGIINAFMHIVTTVGPLQVLLAAYIFLLLLALVSELKKHRRKQADEHRAFEAAVEARRVEEQRRQTERNERINKYKQRDEQKKKGPRVPQDAMVNYQAQRINRQPGVRGR